MHSSASPEKCCLVSLSNPGKLKPMQRLPPLLPELASHQVLVWPGPDQLELLFLKPVALPQLARSLLALNSSKLWLYK